MFDAARENDIAKRSEWYQAILKGIEALEHPELKTDSNSQIQYSMRSPRSDEIDDWLMEHRESSFQEALLEMIDKRRMSHTDFYKAAWMDRKLFSAIKNNPQYQPKKETAIACCLALKLRYSQATKLLRLAGYAFSPANQRDLVIEYCIRNQIWDIDVINNVLYLKSLPPIMTD